MEAATECIPIKPITKSRVPYESLVVRIKRDNMKIASLDNRKNNKCQRVETWQAQKELNKTHTKEKNKNTFKIKSIK